MSYDPHRIESDVQQYWEENNIIETVRESTKGNEPFFMIDGPPYSNGAPHVGHMQGKVLKDVMMRFKQMNGFDVWDQAGFDTHGLPNELATEEALGIEDKNEIGESISVAEFITECRNQATSALDLWSGVMQDLAVWQDFDDPYLTYDKEYIESEWWLVQQAYEQGLLFQALKPIHWCPRCQTSLSGYEVTDEYSEVEDTAVYVTFPLKHREESVMIWTTTPWTIPANMAVFVHPDYRYARVKVGNETVIIADQLVDTVMQKAGYSQDDYDVLNTFPGAELQGKAYEHPLPSEVPKQSELDEEDGVHQIYTSEDLVTLEEGTGVVHAATGHGQEDYEETRRFNLPVFSPVDEEGNYTADAGTYSGAYVHDINTDIVDDLEENGFLFHKEQYSHEYPLCWRCKTKLVYRAVNQWFIENEEVKRRMLEENQDVEWIPGHVQKRFKNFVEKSPDWCISRQNYWGVPLPVWICNSCSDETVIGSFDELSEKTGGLPDDFDPHKHVVDDITWDCSECNGTKTRVPDILDVWFDSGCAPFASVHYPFEEEPLETLWPMDFITEASDQIRGWFYSLLFCGILGFDESPYEKILYQAHVLDDKGKKMSKSLGNVVDPEEQVEKYGGDLPRFYSVWVAPTWEQTKYDENEIEDEIYRLFSVYWNTHTFLDMYTSGTPSRPDDSELQVEDRWMLSRLHTFLADASQLMEDCEFHTFTRRIEDLILNDLSRWYLKKTRPRIKDGDDAAAWTLYHALEQVTLLLAPFTPHVTEQVYQQLNGEKPSVHMEPYPEHDASYRDPDLEDAMEHARNIVEEALRIRHEKDYNLRWPANTLIISTDEETIEHLQPATPVIKDMANVETVEFGDVAAQLVASPNYASLGPKYGDDADTVAHLIEDLNHEQIEQVQDTGSIVVNGYDIEEDDFTTARETADHVGSKTFDKGEVHLDLHMDEHLEEQAFIAELVRNIQQARKDAGLDVNQEIRLTIQGDTGVVEKHREALEDQLVLADLDLGTAQGEHTGEASFKEYRASFAFTTHT